MGYGVSDEQEINTLQGDYKVIKRRCRELLKEERETNREGIRVTQKWAPFMLEVTVVEEKKVLQMQCNHYGRQQSVPILSNHEGLRKY